MFTRWLQKRSGNLAILAAAGMLFQQGCAVDPDLLLQAGIQFFTEFAIFATDSALVSLR